MGSKPSGSRFGGRVSWWFGVACVGSERGGGGLVGGRVDGVVLVTEKVVVKLWDDDDAVVV